MTMERKGPKQWEVKVWDLRVDKSMYVPSMAAIPIASWYRSTKVIHDKCAGKWKKRQRICAAFLILKVSITST